MPEGGQTAAVDCQGLKRDCFQKASNLVWMIETDQVFQSQ